MGRSTDTRNPEPFELVGTKDLRESFKDGKRARGSFYLNGVEMHQFDANSPASVVSQINAKTNSHYLTAEIDDGGHLVLVDRSGAEPQIRMGQPWQEPPLVSSGDAIKDAAATQKRVAEEKERQESKETILDMLGLTDAANESSTSDTVQPGFETGLSAEERKERYKQERAMRDGNGMQLTPQGTVIYPNRAASGPAGTGRGLKLPSGQVPSNPTPGDVGQGQGSLADGRARTGTGGGSGETAASTIQKTHETPMPAPAQ